MSLKPKHLSVLLSCLTVIGGAGLVVLLFTSGCGSDEAKASSNVAAAPAQAPAESGEDAPRVIILGFDAVEPSIVDAMLTAGELPNLAKLRDQGTYQRLASSNPPQSPTAWSSFATCLRPGNHGIYDFLRRNPSTYFPGLGFGTTKHPELTSDGAVAKPAHYEGYRKGETLWAAANRQGARCKLLIVPYAYPIEPLQNSSVLAGLEVPDIRGTQSTFFAFSERFTEQEDVPGGVRLPLKFEGDSATVNVPGVRHPKTRRFVEAPLKVTVNRAAHTVAVDVQGQTANLAEGVWSDWLEWDFEVTPKFTIKAISRIHVLEAGDTVRLYMTCLQIHPRQPYLPISEPGEYAAELADRYGLYRTVGWAYDTKALQKDAMTEDLFLEDARRRMAWIETFMIDELELGRFDLLIAGWTGTDRVSHMFWRFRDPQHPLYTKEGAEKYGRAVEETYMKMDAIIGEAMARLKPNDLLMVMSDHGFHGFRKGFSANTWLVRNGYLTIKGQTDRETAYTDTKYLQAYDWSKTKAYALGLGSIFLNLKGRERDGTVTPQEAPALLQELKDKLLTVVDPDTGAKVLRNVYLQSEVYTGAAEADAPDIQLGYADGYQTAKPSAAGAAPKDLLIPNDDKWSGDHAASDVDITPGVLFANKPTVKDPAIIDLGVTALEYLGLSVPEAFEGRALL